VTAAEPTGDPGREAAVAVLRLRRDLGLPLTSDEAELLAADDWSRHLEELCRQLGLATEPWPADGADR
jgi:hypothetical protein